MSGKSLMFNSPKKENKIITPVTSAKVVKGANKNHVVKDLPKVDQNQIDGSTIDNIETNVAEIIEESTAVEIIVDTKIDDEIVNDEVNQDPSVNDHLDDID